MIPRSARFLVAFLAAAAAIVFSARRSGSPDPAPTEPNVEIDAGRDSVLRFWEHQRAATEHRIAGRFHAAVAAYESALSFNPSHEDALYYLGNMQLQIGNPARAAQAWRLLTAANTSSSRGYVQLGRLNLCRDYPDLLNFDSAAANFGRALEINREETGPLLWLGEVALVRGDLAGAEEYLRDVVASNYANRGAHLLLAFVLWERGSRRAAEQILTETGNREGEGDLPEGASGEGDTESGSSAMVLSAAPCAGLAVATESVYPGWRSSSGQPGRLFLAVRELIAEFGGM